MGTVLEEIGRNLGLLGVRASGFKKPCSPKFCRKIQASDPEASDYFGYNVATSGDRIVVGAYTEDTTASNAGSVYMYDRLGDFIAKLQASDPEANDLFGYSVAISGDRIVVGAPYENTTATFAGSAYIYDSSGNFIKKIQASDPEGSDNFGYSVAISGDRVIVGAPYEDTTATDAGSAYIYDSSGNFIAKIQASDPEIYDSFGISVAISGDRVIVGAYGEDSAGGNAGSTYIYDSSGNFITKIQASDPGANDNFGISVAISGDRVIVGAPYEDTGGADSGSAYIYDSSGNFIAKIQASDPSGGDKFGYSVGISGDRIVVGAYGEDTTASNAGSAYIYDSSGNSIKKIQASDPEASDFFGYNVAISGDRIVVGSYTEDTTAANAGSIYIYDNVSGNLIDIMLANLGHD